MKRLGCWLGGLLCAVVALIAAAWAFGAVWFDGPFGTGNRLAAALLVTVLAVVLLFVRPFWRKLGVFVVLFAGVLIWWLSLSPTDDADWDPDVTRTAWADVQGDNVTFHNVRNCDYRTATDYTPRWETRTVHISQITGIDLAIDYWGSPWIAHPILSFQFADAPPLCFSIEVRKKIGQTYSASAGSIGNSNSSTSWPTNATLFVCGQTSATRIFIFIARPSRRRVHANVSSNTSIRSMPCATNRAGITPSPPTAPPVSVRNIRLTSVRHGTGASCSTAKATS